MELITIFEDDGGLYYVSQPSWQFGIDDDEMHQFGVIFEILNMYEATGEEQFEDYPYAVEASIVAHEPHEDFSLDQGLDPEDISWEGRMYDAYYYMGGVAIHHVILATSSSGSKGIMALLEGIPEDDYEISGRPVFRTEDAAKQYVQNIVDSGRLDGLGMMIGFILDRPVNMIGETGWRTVTMGVKGPEYRGNNPSNPSTKKLKTKLLR